MSIYVDICRPNCIPISSLGLLVNFDVLIKLYPWCIPRIRQQNAPTLLSMKLKNNNYLNKKYEIVVTIKTMITQIERLARNCFSLEFECKKLGSTNINTPIK